MMNRRKRRCGTRGLLVALALLCLLPPSAEAQRRRWSERVQIIASDFRSAILGPPQQARSTLRACESMYDDEARQMARGAEPVGSRVRWLETSYELIRNSGPLPLCFEHLRDTLTTRLGRRLLAINNYYLEQNPSVSFWLTGFTDSAEHNLVLAQKRAEEVHQLSRTRDCHRARHGALLAERRFQRRVVYTTREHRPPNCLPSPGR